MGCSLCSLQKPEEQYRLLYEVCQVTLCICLRGRGQALTWQTGTSGKGAGDLGADLRSERDRSSDFAFYSLLNLLGDFPPSGTSLGARV